MRNLTKLFAAVAVTSFLSVANAAPAASGAASGGTAATGGAAAGGAAAAGAAVGGVSLTTAVAIASAVFGVAVLVNDDNNKSTAPTGTTN